MTPGFTTHESSHGRKQKRTLRSPWEISDTYSGLQMSAILMNTPKIMFLGISFLRMALKSQDSLAGVVLQNRHEINLLIPEKENHSDPTGSQRTSCRVLRVAIISL